MARKIHPKAAIEAALRHAEQKGWTVEPSNSHAHAWGRLSVHITIKTVDAVNFVYPAYGVHLKVQKITRNKSTVL
jgi:hypothetical protein